MKFFPFFPNKFQNRSGESPLSWDAAASQVFAWFPAAMLGVYLKHIELSKQYLPISRTIGRKPGEHLSFLEKLTFFRLDILVCMVAIPLVLMVLLRFSAHKFRSALVITVSFVFALLFFVNFQSMGNIGRYMSFELLKDAADWSLSQPWFITQYIKPEAMAKMAVVIALIVLGAVPWEQRSPGYPALSRDYLRKGKLIAFVVVVSVSCLVSALAWLPRFPVLPQHGKPAIQTALLSLIQFEDASTFKDTAPERVVTLYREFTRSPAPRQWPALAGREAASDVIFFVFESGPGRSLDLTGNIDDFPNLAALRKRAFVAERHHSTYPYTSDALYSMFSSHYAAHVRAKAVKSNSKTLNTGVFWNLRNAGYATSTHAPSKSRFDNDTQMFAGLGVDRQFAPEFDRSISSAAEIQVKNELDRISSRLNADSAEKARLESILKYDLMALESVAREIEKNKSSGRRFVTAYLPQVGHGPWLDIDNNGSDHTARGRALMALQDRWLGRLLTLLRRNLWLDNTIIVVTADHGVRTKKEDPRFNGGMISEYSFHVPLLIFAPNTLTEEKRIPWVTSHIDITPSILDLMGITGERRFEQGTVIWDPRIANRKTFFHAKGYLGADGFHDNGRYYMINHHLGSAYGNRKLDFSADDLILPGNPANKRVRDTIEFMRNIQTRWGTLRDQ